MRAFFLSLWERTEVRVYRVLNPSPLCPLSQRERGGITSRCSCSSFPQCPCKSVAHQLGDELGFDGVDAGGLDESWRQQPGTPVYAADFDAEGVREALSQASKERKPEWRAKWARIEVLSLLKCEREENVLSNECRSINNDRG